MKKLLLPLSLMILSACSTAPAAVIAPTATPTFQVLPSATVTIRPTSSQTHPPRPIGADEIARLGGKLTRFEMVSSPDGKTYTITDDSGVHLYASESKKEINFFSGEMDGVEYSPNSQMIVVVDANAARLIRLSDGEVLGKFKVGFESIPHVFSPDSKRFAYLVDCSWFYEPDCKETIHVWDIPTQQEVFAIKAQSVITVFRFFKLAFDPTGAFLLASDSNGVIHVWDASNGKAAFNLQSPSGHASALVFSHDGKHLASFDDGAKRFNILLWNWDTKERRTVTGQYSDSDDLIRSMIFSADDSQITLIFYDDSTVVWDLTSGKLSQGEKFINQEALRLQQMRERGEYIASPDSIAYSPDTQTLAVGGFFVSPIVLWDLQTKKVRATLDGKATHLQYTHQGNRLIVLYAPLQNMTEEDSDVSIWDTTHNVKLHTFKIPQAITFDISPDDSTLAINSFHAIQLWNIEKGTLIQSLSTPGLLESPHFVSYSADGKSIHTALLKALGQREYELSVWSWDAMTGASLDVSFQPIHLGNSDSPISLHHDILAAFQYLPDTTIVLWDVKSGKKLQAILIDAYHPPDLIFTPNDRLMVLDSFDASVFYNLQTGSQMYEMNLGGAPLAFSEDGNQLAVSDNNGSIYLWDISRILQTALEAKP